MGGRWKGSSESNRNLAKHWMVHYLCIEGDHEQTSNICRGSTAYGKVPGFLYTLLRFWSHSLWSTRLMHQWWCFLEKTLQDTCQKLMQKFVKKSILDSADTAYKVANLDVLDMKNHRSVSDIDLGFATKTVLTNLVKKKAVSERGVLESKMECVRFLSNLTHKILERSPLKYKLVRSPFCLNPKKMAEVPEECSKAFETVLTKVTETKWRASSEADDLLEQYRRFLQFVKKDCDSDFKNKRKSRYLPLWLHPWQKRTSTPVEGVQTATNTVTQLGICLKEDSVWIVNQWFWTVYDAVQSLDGDLSSFTITKELLTSCRWVWLPFT